jgi:hypothetical protein
VDGGNGYIVTAAHCLPHVPPAHLARHLHAAEPIQLLDEGEKLCPKKPPRGSVWTLSTFLELQEGYAPVLK